uniref:PFO n=1 Tax=Acanthamoeba castellanii TaxID=5755 RepID=A0A090X7D2_ACACA
MNRLFARHTRPIVAQRTFPLSSAGTLRALSTPRWTAGPLRRLHGAVPMDGNTAAAHVAYGLSDIHAIYPITPSSQMGELADKWSAEGRLNAFGNTPRVIEMQSEMGAAGTLHGAAVGGALVSTFTASQGLLLMIPNLYRVAGELMPAVFHVTARAISGQGLSIYGDHSDVMAVKQTGVAMLASASPQEAMDLALVAHLSSIRSSVPFVHFFDGFRTSHEINTVEPIKYEDMRKLLDEEALEQFRRRGMNPETPNLRGLIDGPEHYFQQVEAANTILDGVLPVVEGYLDEVHKLTGRKYGLFDYHGHPEPRHVIVACGSSVSTVEEAVNHRNAQGERVGLIKVRLWRPFSIKHLVDALPKSVEKVAVIDRVRDYLASGGPLFQEVCTSLMMGGRRDVQLVNGRYGLGSKDFTPGMALAIFDNLKQDQPLHNFVVGIKDDVTHKSLTVTEEPDTLPAGTKQSIFWGIGGDGTVGANEEAIKLIVENSNMYGQGYFAYSAHKSGGVTVSHLRFGEKPINSTYQVQNADLIAVHTTPYLKKFPSLLGPLKEGGTVILNSPWNDVAHLDRMLPDFVKRRIARRKARLINVDATAIAHEAGLRGRINMVMQAAFFKASEVLPLDVARAELRRVIDAQYARKGRDVLERNYAALDQGLARTVEVAYPDAWAECRDDVADYIVPDPADAPEQLRKVLRPTQRMEGDSLPVSAFDPRGAMPSGTSKYEKRGIAPAVAQWTNPDTCTQCNLCSALCPHAAIRPFLFTQEEAGSAPEGWEGRKAVGKAGKSYQYRVQVSPYDCTGCDVCVKACDDAVRQRLCGVDLPRGQPGPRRAGPGRGRGLRRALARHRLRALHRPRHQGGDIDRGGGGEAGDQGRVPHLVPIQPVAGGAGHEPALAGLEPAGRPAAPIFAGREPLRGPAPAAPRAHRREAAAAGARRRRPVPTLRPPQRAARAQGRRRRRRREGRRSQGGGHRLEPSGSAYHLW